MIRSRYSLKFCSTGVGLVALGVLVSSGQVYGACNFTNGTTGPAIVNFPAPKSLSIPADTPNGTKVHTVNGSGGTASFICSVGDRYGIKDALGAVAVNQILPFADSGLGYRLYSAGGPDSVYPTSSGSGGLRVGVPYVMEIYKIGPIKKNKVAGRAFASFVAENLTIYSASLVGDLNIAAASCDIRSTNVEMGRHLVSDFKGVGSSLKAKSFNIELVGCSAGINTIKYRLDAANGSFDAGRGIAKLDAGGVPGVGIQIKRGDNPVPLGEWLSNLAAPLEGNNAYGFSAAYYQAEKKIDNTTVGRANLSLTVTVNYL